MGSFAAFILVFSPIRQTIPKSKWWSPRIDSDFPDKNRVLLAGIKSRGNCLCPRCLIPLDRIQNMGMPRDRQQRVTLKRIDNERRHYDIENARRLIYERNYAVNSKTLAKFLNTESWVPTLVRMLTLIFCNLR